MLCDGSEKYQIGVKNTKNRESGIFLTLPLFF